jgi:hypothetical protein
MSPYVLLLTVLSLFTEYARMDTLGCGDRGLNNPGCLLTFWWFSLASLAKEEVAGYVSCECDRGRSGF